MLVKPLRLLSVGQRIAIIIGLLLLPMTVLSIISAVVLSDQEVAFRDSVEESVNTLLPLTTLEHYLQQALVDELEAQSQESVPDFASLTDNIDKSFSRIESTESSTDPAENSVVMAQRAWRDARPSVQQLIEQVHRLRATTSDAVEASSRNDLQQAIGDIGAARKQLARAVRARYAHAVAARHTQLMWLVWSWVITLSIAAIMLFVLLRSLLGPIRALGRAAHALSNGKTGVRVAVNGNDELTVLAGRFNEMAAYWESSRQSLMSEAAEDPLTGALNRRGILAALDMQLATHAPQHAPLSLFMVDLDRFKAINDQLGHSAGDRALMWVTSKMREMLRDQDQLGRYGGDEFLVVLPQTSYGQAQGIASRMVGSIGDIAAREAAYPAISIGVASAPAHGWEAAGLIEAADAALYEAKNQRHAISSRNAAAD